MSTPSPTIVSEWVERIPPVRHGRLRLFCFHHAGGSGVLFRSWGAKLGDDVEICAVQLPARGRRLNEPPIGDMQKLAGAAVEGLLPFLDRPFAFFGHSMGALIAYEVAALLFTRYEVSPELLAVAACPAPGHRKKHQTYDLPRDEFLKELRVLGGTPPEVLENAELLEIVLPALRADFQIVETYQPSSVRLRCPVAAYGGSADHSTSPELLARWEDFTSGRFQLTLLQGDHFFVNSHKAQFLQLITRELAACGVPARCR